MRAVVIGSGFGGLAAAIRLAAAGHDVTVVDKRDRIGGRAYQYEVDGFRFDGGPTVLTAPFMFEELFALAGEQLADHVDLVPLDPFYRAFDADDRPFDYHADLESLLAEVAGRSPGDVAGARRLVRRISGIFDAFYPYTERPMMRPQVMLAMLPYLLQHRAMLDVHRMVRGCVRDPFLRQALAFHPLLIGGDPRRTPALYALIVEFERRWGVHYAMGGTGALVAALGGLLERLGGRFVLGPAAEVRRVLVERRRVAGVELADGGVLAADVVVSNADPGHTYVELLDGHRRPRNPDRRYRRARPSMSLHVLYLGADRTWPDSPLAHHNLVFSGNPEAALGRVFRSGRPTPARRRAGSGQAGPATAEAEELFLYVHVPTRTDPSVAPGGCEALYVLVAEPALPRDRGRSGALAEDAGSEGAAAARARRIRDQVVETLDRRFLPGLADHIVAEHAIGPEHFRDVLNTPRGAAFSLQPTLFQSGWFRPHNRSPDVAGLYLVGAGTHPGAGVPAVLASGRIAADLVAEDLRLGRIAAAGARASRAL